MILLVCSAFMCCQTKGQNNKEGHRLPQRTSDAKHTPSWRQPLPPGIFDTLPKVAERVGESRHFNIFSFGKIEPAGVERLIAELENSVSTLAKRFGLQYNDPIPVYLYPSCEIKGLLRRNNSRSEIDSTRSAVHLVVNAAYASIIPSEPTEVFLLKSMANSKTPALTCGLAIAHTPKWQRLGHREWATRLADAGLLPDLKDLLNMELWSTYSDIIAESLTASFVEFLEGQLPAKQFLELYHKATIDTLLHFEQPWKIWLQQSAEGISRPPKPQPMPYLRGFNFAHEGYQIFNGYGSKLAMQSLKEALKLGSNAVAIVPYSFLRNATVPSPIPVARFAGGENDEAVMGSCFHAKSLGMYTLLKPQIWLGRGQWPGDIEMSSEKDWNLFFTYYTYWIAHYALLAEIHQVPGFCIGTELSKTTTQRPDDWRFLIHRIRLLFSGHLTYAANWGNEFEELNFWDEFDYIGLNCYYPLSTSPTPTDQELRMGIRSAYGKAQSISKRFHKKVLLTEAGFPTTVHPWIEPHRDGKEMQVSYAAQARCFSLLLEELEDEDWCGGILIWKWPSYPRKFHGDRPTFHINGHPAEKVVEECFKHLQSN